MTKKFKKPGPRRNHGREKSLFIPRGVPDVNDRSRENGNKPDHVFLSADWLDVRDQLGISAPVEYRAQRLLGHAVLKRELQDSQTHLANDRKHIMAKLFSRSVEVVCHDLLHDANGLSGPDDLVLVQLGMLADVSRVDQAFSNHDATIRYGYVRGSLAEAHNLVTGGNLRVHADADRAKAIATKHANGILGEYKVAKTLQSIGWPQTRYASVRENLDGVDIVTPLGEDPSYPDAPPVEMQVKTSYLVDELVVYTRHAQEPTDGFEQEGRRTVPLIVVPTAGAGTSKRNMFGATEFEKAALKDFMHGEIERYAA